jgi:hypothetical protein
MAKYDESEGEVLSREEMKSTKGGAGAAAAAAETVSAADLKQLNTMKESLQAETLNVVASKQNLGVNAPPIPPSPLKK